MRCVQGEPLTWESTLLAIIHELMVFIMICVPKCYQNSVSFGNSNAIFIDNVIPNCLYLFRSDHFDQKTDQ